MSKFKINSIEKIHLDTLSKGVFIWVIHVNKIPPHLGISSNGKFYSLKAYGKDDGINHEIIFKILEKKHIQALFIEIETKLSPQENNLNLKNVFDNYKSINVLNSTCLTPILQFLKENDKIQILAQLLEKLQEKNQIKRIFGLNLNTDFKGIPIYSKTEVENRILKIQNVKRSTHFFESN